MSKMGSFYRKKLFGECAKKKKAADKDKINKGYKPNNKTLSLASK